MTQNISTAESPDTLAATLMKLILIIILLVSSTLSYTQNCCEIVKLPFETLDSNEIKKVEPMIKDSVHHIVCFGSDDGVKLAYLKSDENKWISFSLPFTTPVVGIKSINLDGKGQPEIILDGTIMEYGSGGGRQTSEMLIINVDSVPTQVFDVVYSCLEESYGKYGSTPSANGYRRKITIRQREIVVARLNRKKIPYAECDLTTIPAGIYIMVAGRIKKK